MLEVILLPGIPIHYPQIEAVISDEAVVVGMSLHGNTKPVAIL